jgi:hypothetical protein
MQKNKGNNVDPNKDAFGFFILSGKHTNEILADIIYLKFGLYISRSTQRVDFSQ